MSKSWAGGSTRSWRRTRAAVLARDGYKCKLRIPGVCIGAAPLHATGDTPAGHCHHVNGKANGDGALATACAPCNMHVGDPTRFPHRGTPRTPAVSVQNLSPSSTGDLVVRAELAWDPERLAAWEWLVPFLEVPEDAAPPLAMSLPPEDAVGSYGAEAVAWIEETQRIRLRWWQALAVTRQLEYRAGGSLCARVVVESAPRRAGKSVRVRGLTLWRMAHADLFGEVQLAVHTGSNVAICREIQRGAWRWAEDVAGWTVSRSNGKEAVETPTGDRWLVRATSAVYGYDVTLGIVDEAWDVSPDTVSEGLEPATLERSSPQLHLTSTAHRRATSLMRARLQTAMGAEDPDTLLLLWAAPAGADPGDPEVWRAASPHWSEDRCRMIADKYAKALAGEADPQADDPDPMAGFTAQYLNRWQLRPVVVNRGDPAVSPVAWAALVVDRPEGPPAAAAVESWFADGVALALAWRSGGHVVVTVQDLADLSQVRGALKEAGFRGRAKVGASLLEDPSMVGVRATKGQGRTGAAVAELRRLLDEGVFRHDGSELLTEQVLAARTTPGADGPRMVSTGAADAIKAAVWSATECRRPSVGKPRLVVAP